MTYKRKTRDLCQTDWQNANPGEYAPDTIRSGTCAECGSDDLVYRSAIADETQQGRAFIKSEIARLLDRRLAVLGWPRTDTPNWAEAILRPLEDVGFETGASLVGQLDS